jgi:hypothetical protein
MVKFLEACPLSYDRYFTELEEFTLKQLDSHQKANLAQKEKLVVLGNIPKVIVASISQNSQPNLTVTELSSAPEEDLYQKLYLKLKTSPIILNV